MSRLEDIRKNFTKTRGGKLILVESFLVFLILSFILTVCVELSQVAAFAISAIVAFIFPIIVAVFKTIAWLMAIIFSFIWALITWVISTSVEAPAIISLGVGMFIFVVSFFIHKVYSGLQFNGIEKKSNNNKAMELNGSKNREKIQFCPKCGRRIISPDGRCDVCDK